MKRHTGERNEDLKAARALIDGLGVNEARAAALSDLCALAKSPDIAREITEALPNRAPIYAALTADEPKTRKNAARLLGALRQTADAPALIEALKREETLFVRPSLILALGAVGGEAALPCLKALPLPEGEDKHAREERDAIMAAIARLSPLSHHTFTGLTAPERVRLIAPAGFGPLLAEELKALGIGPIRRVTPDWVRLDVRDMKALYGARCFSEALFPLAQDVQCDLSDEAKAGEAAAAAARMPLMRLVKACHAGEPPFAYRVECRFQTDRGQFARAFARRLDPTGAALCNNPSQYEAEVRVDLGEEGRLNVFCKLLSYRDQRFAYRKHQLSASIHPATAAALCRYCEGFFTPGHKPLRVLDPCCGSGTLLIERGRLAPPPACLTGVDIVREAVEKARENGKLAHSEARFVQKDCLSFVADAPYDLVLSNLPFGARVGTHKDNEALYAGLIHKLPEWLAPGGIAVLYTMEYALLSRLVKTERALVPMGQARTEAGGLLPWVIALSRR